MLYHRALMVIHQGCPQTPGGRIRALGFARMGARGCGRSPRTDDIAGMIDSAFASWQFLLRSRAPTLVLFSSKTCAFVARKGLNQRKSDD